MDRVIVYHNGKKITEIYDIEGISYQDYSVEHIKNVAFVDTQNFSLNPMFTHISEDDMTQDTRHVTVISAVDIIARERPRITSKEYQDNLYKNLSRDFKSLTEELYVKVLRLVFYPEKEENKKFVQDILNTLPDYQRLILKYTDTSQYNLQQEPNSEEDEEDEAVFASSNKDTLKDLIRKVEEKENKKVIQNQDENIEVHILSYKMIVTKPRDRDINLEKIFSDVQLSQQLIAVGMLIGGDPKFKKVKTDDRKVTGKINDFIKSEHLKGQVKTLKPGVLYFMFKSPRSIIYGTLVSNGALVIKIKPIKTQLPDFEKHLEDSKMYGNEIMGYFKDTAFTINENISVFNISIKVIKKGGYFPLDLIKKIYKGRNDHSIVRFDNGDIRNIMYSTKNKVSNFTYFNILKGGIDVAIKNIEYLKKNFGREEVSITPTIKNIKIRELKNAGIGANSKECQKPRRPQVLPDGQVAPKDVYTMEINGKVIVCNKEYPWPGFTKKSNVPCCFKKPQKEKTTQQEIQKTTYQGSLQNRDTVKRIFDIRPLVKDDVKLERYKRGKPSNKILSNIFKENFYSLSPGPNSGIYDALKFIYGEDIIPESINAMSQEDFDRCNISSQTLEEWKQDQNKSTESVVKAVSSLKKVNPLIIMDTVKGTEMVCSMTDYFFNSQYLILLRNEMLDTVNILIKMIPGDIVYELSYDNPEIQELVKVYNQSCHSVKKCKFHILSLFELLKKGIKIKSQIVNSINKVYYVETEDYGILPILPTNIDYSLPSKRISDITLLKKIDQYNKLVEISKKFPYLRPSKKVKNYGEEQISGIEVECGMVSPVIDEEEKLPEDITISDANFYLELEDILKSDIISDDELSIFKQNTEENYFNIAKRVLSQWYKENSNKTKIDRLIREEKYDDLIEFVSSLFTRDNQPITKTSLPVEEVMPLKINNDYFVNVVSRLVFSMINEQELFFDEENKKKNRIDVQFISNEEEISIS